MTVTIKHQDHYSRGLLLLRTILGALYIALPHAILLFFVGLWGGVLAFLAWWAVLFTGKYPKSFHEYQVGYLGWQTRVSASLLQLTDEYPAFGFKGTDQAVSVELPTPERSSRGILILRILMGLYVFLPHGICLLFRSIWGGILIFLAWWAVLFTGSYPASWHAYNAGTLRWVMRIYAYSFFLTDEYPPFSGK